MKPPADVEKRPQALADGRVELDYQARKIGLESVRMLFDLYPEAKKWTLDTPAWNRRTRPFYCKLGFRIVGETGEGLLLFEKKMD